MQPEKVEFTNCELVVTLSDGRKETIMPMGIRWPDLDEDLSVTGMLKGRHGAASAP